MLNKVLFRTTFECQFFSVEKVEALAPKLVIENPKKREV